MKANLNSNWPLVTAIAVCYNHERFVKECLESIKHQDYPNLELLIVDDCSKDTSAALIREWLKNNPSLNAQFIDHRSNQGLCKSLNEAVTLGCGDYFGIIAADDVWEPWKTIEQVRILQNLQHGIGIIYSDARQIDEEGNLLPKTFIETHYAFQHPPEGWIHETLWKGNFIAALTVMVRRCVFETVGSYDEALFYEDWDFWLRASQHYAFTFYADPCARYRIVSTSMQRASENRIYESTAAIYVKYLLTGTVPRFALSKAFNCAVKRAYALEKIAPLEGDALFRKLLRMYWSPRLVMGWLLFRAGMGYGCYEGLMRSGRFIMGRGYRRQIH